MPDTLKPIGHSLIQHGPDSDRVYLMKLDPTDRLRIGRAINALVGEHGYGKVFAKVPESAEPMFIRQGYRREAAIPGYYPSGEPVVFLARYPDPDRSRDPRADRCAEILALARAQPVEPAPELPTGFVSRRLAPADLPVLAAVYREVFESYPFPIHDPDYLARTMASHVAYYGVFKGDRLVAAASAERDLETQTAEMTDFATLPDVRNQGLARTLLSRMAADREALGIRLGYTIARALSHGMNITFARTGYAFGGTLVNNTQICGRIESMNVWYRRLA
jgi:beta-lysine N6-acetyltransferase